MRFSHRSTLRLGDDGPEVADLSAYLTHFGYLAGEASRGPAVESPKRGPKDARSRFDGALEHALGLFQTVHGLGSTGRLDEETLSLVRRPRCGVPDVRRNPRASLGSLAKSAPKCRWPRPSLTFCLLNLHPTMGGAQRRVMLWSLDQWAKASDGKLSFSEGEAGSDIQTLNFDFGDGCGGTYAYSYFPCDRAQGSRKPAGDMYFDVGDCFSADEDTPGDRADFVSVCLHEVGHALGLDHEPSLPDAVMYPYFDLGAQRRRLTADDVNGIRLLYP